MPYSIRKLPNKDLYRVYNTQNKAVHSYATTLENAKKQVTLLHMVDAGVPLKEGGAISQSEKVKIAEEIKPITLEKAKESYLDLEDDKTIPPTTSRKGNEFVDYFTFLERLETKGNKGISFWEFWENKSEYMKKQYVKNLLNYLNKGGKKDLVKDLYKVFGLYFGAPMIFKPVIAMSVYHRFKPTSILDFTMGWGGRLVGAAALDIPKYTGIDLNKNLEKPYREMEKTLKELGTTTNIKLIFQDALKVDYSKIDYDMVFTSPPYYNVELYRGTNKMTEEEWNENFYRPLFTKTWKHLKNGGQYILNVPKAVYDNVLIDLLGKADILLPLGNKRSMAKKLKQAEYTEYMYVWVKNGMKKGGSIETDLFEEKGVISLPEFRSVKLNLPTYMYKRLPDIKGKPPPYRYRLVIPITSSRNLSSRKQETSLNINQKPVSRPIIDVTEVDDEDKPLIEEFSPADKAKIQEYYYKVKANERKNPDEVDKDPYAIVERGRPLPCENAKPKKEKPAPKGKKVKSPPKPVGRPKKGRKLLELQGEKAGYYDEEGDFIEASDTSSSSGSSSTSASSAPKKKNQQKSAFRSLKPSDAFDERMERRKKIEAELKKRQSLDDLFASLVNDSKESVSSKSSKSSKKSSKSSIDVIDLLPSFSSKSSKSSSVSSDLSLPSFPSMSSSKKSSKASSLSSLSDFDPDAELEKVLGKKSGKGLENNISSNNKMANSWIEYVKEFASKNGMSYRDALRDPKCKAGYKKGGVVKKGRGVVDEIGNQDLISIAYDDSELGANAGKKYISL